jgi:CRISPR type III-B/RAMP module RAMP protein Cmr6
MIPISKDTRALIGDFAEGVDNRSLLYEKFSLPKVWGQHGKLHDAGRWSVLRIVTRGDTLLQADAARMEYAAGGRNVRPDKAERLRREAQIARKLAVIATPDPKLADAAADNARRLLDDLHKSHTGHVETFQARLAGRLLVNQAGGVVENAGLCLDRCFGLPYLPGSAVKGITRAQAILEVQEAKPEERDRLLQLAMLLFGFGGNDLSDKGDFVWAGGAAHARKFADLLKTKEWKGLASFLPAYPTEPPTLVVDMVNPHHREYYRSRGQRPATDDEDPTPNYFPAVEAGSAFGFAVVLNRLPLDCSYKPGELLFAVRQWLEHAITRKGAGAKTAAGYGWFWTPGQEPAKTFRPAPVRRGTQPTTRPGPPASPLPAERAGQSGPSQPPQDPLVQKWRGKLGSTGNFAAVLPDLLAVDDLGRLRQVFDLIFPATEVGSLKAGKRTPYWQSFSSRPQGAAILQKIGYKLRK